MNEKRWLCLAATALALPTVLRAQTPLGTAFTYQGQLKQEGVPVNGTCDFAFALWDDPELAEPANNKGEAGAGGVQVSNGLFAAKVDFGSGTFDGSARWLQVHVCCPSGSCAGDVGWEMLSPRQELTPTPYALYAASADGGVGGFWSASGDHIYSTNVGNVGIGTSEPGARLHVGGGNIRLDVDGSLEIDAQGGRAFEMRYDANTATGHLVAAARQLELSSGWTEQLIARGGQGGIRLNIQTGSENDSTMMFVANSGNVGIGTTEPTAKLTIGGTPGADGVMFPDGTLQTTAATGGDGLTLPYSASVSSGSTLFEVYNTGAGGAIYGEASGSGEAAQGVWGRATGTNTAGVFGQAMGFTGRAVHGVAENTGPTTNYGGLFEAKGETAHGVHAEATNFGDGPNYGGYFAAAGRYGGGVYALALGNDAQGVHADATGSNGVGVYARSETGKAVDALTTSASTNEWTPAVYARNEGAGDGLYGWSQSRHGVVGVTSSSNPDHAAVWAKNNGAGPALLAEGGSTGRAAVFKGNVEIRSATTGATVIELGEGLDYAEGFDVTDGSQIEPGAVLVIDPANSGKLMLSSQPYDRRVAGIVAGAGGLGSAVRLGAGIFDRDVALAGRVYCNVDTTLGAVSPGDLLTTSPTPGYAMVVKDHVKAQGAILGKAMQALPKDKKAQILVLVTLQ